MSSDKGELPRPKVPVSELSASSGLQGRVARPSKDTREKTTGPRPLKFHFRSKPIQDIQGRFQGIASRNEARRDKNPSQGQNVTPEEEKRRPRALNANSPSKTPTKRLESGDISGVGGDGSRADHSVGTSGEAASQKSSTFQKSSEFHQVASREAKERELSAQQNTDVPLGRLGRPHEPGQSYARHREDGARDTEKLKNRRARKSFDDEDSSSGDSSEGRLVSKTQNMSKSMFREPTKSSAAMRTRREGSKALRLHLMNRDNISNGNRTGARVTKKRKKRESAILKFKILEEKRRITNLRAFSSDYWNNCMD